MAYFTYSILSAALRFCSLDCRAQVMAAVKLRAQTDISGSDRTIVNQIVHSGDTKGQYADVPNPYRDSTFSHDNRAQGELDRLNKKWF
jgi:hypothetical protein